MWYCSESIKESFHEELESTVDELTNYHMNILSRDINANLAENKFWNLEFGMSIHMKPVMIMKLQVLNFATSKTLIAESIKFPHCNIPDGKTQWAEHILIDRDST